MVSTIKREQPHWSRPLYLYFLDRELLSAFSLYDDIPTRAVELCFRLALLSTYEKCYFSLSLVFENKHAWRLFQKYGRFFQSGHIELVSSSHSLEDFIQYKKEQYPKNIKDNFQRYTSYYDNTWRVIARKGVEISNSHIDTGDSISGIILKHVDDVHLIKSASKLRFRQDPRSFENLSAKVHEAISSRNTRAVTHSLFEDTIDCSEYEISRTLRVMVSENYVSHYVNIFGGTIPTGLPIGLRFFDFLSPTYPIHDMACWREVFRALDLWPAFQELTSIEILAMRESYLFGTLIENIRHFISSRYYEFKNTVECDMRFSDLLFDHIRRALNEHLKPWRLFKDDLDALLSDRISAIMQISSQQSSIIRKSVSKMSNRNVFVIHGRNEKSRIALFALLRAGGLIPMEWSHAIHSASSGAAPYVGDVVDRAMDSAAAVVALFTGDDIARLRDELHNNDEPKEKYSNQPRANVIFETGMAFAKKPDKVIIVQVGEIRTISDLLGRHVVRMDNTVGPRKDLLERLKMIGCEVDLQGHDWMSAGDF